MVLMRPGDDPLEVFSTQHLVQPQTDLRQFNGDIPAQGWFRTKRIERGVNIVSCLLSFFGCAGVLTEVVKRGVDPLCVQFSHDA